MSSNDNKFSNPKLAPSSSRDVKVIEITPYPEVNGICPLIPQIYVDFRSWENRTCTREILLNLIQTSKNNKMIHQTKLTDPQNPEKLQNSELK